jgi:hypothetical protein
MHNDMSLLSKQAHFAMVEPEYAAVANACCKQFGELWYEQTQNADIKNFSPDMHKFTNILHGEPLTEQNFKSLISTLMSNSFVGCEEHEDSTLTDFLCENLNCFLHITPTPTTTLYLEGIPREAQSIINDFLSMKIDENSEDFLIFSNSIPEKLKSLIIEAKKTWKSGNGMRIIGIDSDFAKTTTFGNKNAGPDDWKRPRVLGFNYIAVKTIEEDTDNRAGNNFIVLVGVAHGKETVESGEKIIGVAPALGCVSAQFGKLPLSEKNKIRASTGEHKEYMAASGRPIPNWVKNNTVDLYIGAGKQAVLSIEK